MRFYLGAAVVIAFLVSGLAWPDTYPPLKENLKLPSITVYDDADRALLLPSALETAEKTPLLLLPVFTKCQMSCPVMVQALREALDSYSKSGGTTNYRVVVFTFDASDTAGDLRDFRIKQKIPAPWKIVRSPDQGAVRSFFDQFSFSIMSSEGGFTHPNEVFVFNGDWVWVGTLFGSKLSAGEISTEFKTARDSLKQDVLGRLKSWSSHPESWVILGALGFLGSLLVLFAVSFRKEI